MKAKRSYTYSDPLRDDFAGTRILTRTVDQSFPFIREGAVWRATSFVLYYGVALPLVWLVARIWLGLRFENRRALKKLSGQGYFLYGNHTQMLDAFVPPLAAFPRRAYTLAGADAVSIRGLGHIVLLLGGLPIPTTLSGLRAFQNAVFQRCREGACIAVYPEAHIWPFYTGIRPFPDTSFYYPIHENAPAVAMVTTYRERRGLFRLLGRPGMTITFSEPMFANPDLSPRSAQRKLRDRVHAFMQTVSDGTDQPVYIRYEQRSKPDAQEKNA